MNRVAKLLVCTALLVGLLDCFACAPAGGEEDCCAVFQCAFCGQTATHAETHVPLSAPSPLATPVAVSFLQAASPDLERVSPPPKA